MLNVKPLNLNSTSHSVTVTYHVKLTTVPQDLGIPPGLLTVTTNRSKKKSTSKTAKKKSR